MNDNAADQLVVRLADLPTRKPYRIDIRGDRNSCATVAHTLDLLDLRKLSFHGTLKAKGKSAWGLEATLGATVVQACSVTLAPVTTRIDTDVQRLFTSDWQEPESGEEVEMPKDDTVEPLHAEIDLMAIVSESLGLALPDYPRAEGAELEISTFAAPDVTPMGDDDVKPFAGLAGLKAKLEDPDAK